MKTDLHIHTSASDGTSSPAEIVSKAAGLGLSIIAITDHDTVNGIEEALAEAQKFPPLLVIPGVELSTDVPHGEVHILGYFIDWQSPNFLRILVRSRDSRRVRAEKMVSKLRDMNIYIDWERVVELAGSGSFGRPHIARVMLEQGYIQSLKEAFQRYIGRDGPAYVEREKMTPAEAVRIIVKEGKGLPVLAHPANIDGLEELISNLQREGLVGMEVYYNGYNAGVIRQLASLSSKYNLIPCGGSDYHGLPNNVETPLGNVSLPSESVERLIRLASQQAAVR